MQVSPTRVLPLEGRRIAFIVVASLWCLNLGCYGQLSGVRKHYDRFEQVTTYKMYNNNIIPLERDRLYFGIISIEFNPVRLDLKGVSKFAIDVRYLGDRWLFVEEKGESLILLVDGERIGFRSLVVHRDVIGGGSVSETARYLCRPQMLRRLANANMIHFKLRGSKSSIECYPSKANMENIRKFVANYVDSVDHGGTHQQTVSARGVHIKPRR